MNLKLETLGKFLAAESEIGRVFIMELHPEDLSRLKQAVSPAEYELRADGDYVFGVKILANKNLRLGMMREHRKPRREVSIVQDPVDDTVTVKLSTLNADEILELLQKWNRTRSIAKR